MAFIHKRQNKINITVQWLDRSRHKHANLLQWLKTYILPNGTLQEINREYFKRIIIFQNKMQIHAKHYTSSNHSQKCLKIWHKIMPIFLICVKLMIVTSLSDQKFNLNTCRTQRLDGTLKYNKTIHHQTLASTIRC